MDKFSNIKRKFLEIRDMRKRTMLHIACQRGSIPILDIILKELRENKVRALRHDVNGDTPLDLACIRGFDARENEMYKQEDGTYTSKRYQAVKRLLEYKDWNGKIVFDIDKTTIRKKMNTPLHWAIYWTDIDLAELVFCEFPG